MALKLVVDGKEYPLILADRMTFREANVIQTEFGIDPLMMDVSRGLTVQQIAALTWVSMHRVDDSVTPDEILDSQVLAVGLTGVEPAPEPAEGEAAAAGANGGKPRKRRSATSRATSGSRG